MIEPTQLTIDGRAEPLAAREADLAPLCATPDRLFAAPQTLRGQIALDTDSTNEEKTS